jgi:hypothetical protein
MSTFGYVETRLDEDGNLEPDLPDDIGFQVLLWSSDSSFALISSFDEEVGVRIKSVTAELERLLRSAEHWPPALALSLRLHKNTPKIFSKDRSIGAFEEAFAVTLRHYLCCQKQFPFVFAEAMSGDDIDFQQGQFYWVLARVNKFSLCWVDRCLELVEGYRTSFRLEDKIADTLPTFDELLAKGERN